MDAERFRPLLFLVILASTVGCERGVQPGEIMVRDSAGIQIAHVDWDAVPVTWRVDSIAEWSFGDGNFAGSPLELHDVRDAVLLSDGSIAILEGSTQEVVWIDPQNEAIRRVGGRGDGPNQFRGLSKAFDGGDGGLFILDSTRKRYVQIDGEGQWLEDGTAPSAIGGILASHRTADGEWYLLSNGPLEETGVAKNALGDEVAQVRRPRWALVRVGLDGAEDVDSVTTVMGTESAVGPVMSALHFGATALFAGSEGGVWLGDSGAPEVSLWAEGRQPTTVVRWDNSKSRAVDESVREALLERLSPRASGEELAAIRTMLPFSDELPAFEGLVSGEDGRLWIGSYASYMAELFQAPQREQEWLVLDLESEQAGRVTTPSGLRVLRTGSDYVLGVHRDELGVESVRLYRLRPQ